MATGKVANMVKDRGFGFIKVDGSDDSDVFFHKDDVLVEPGFNFDSIHVGTCLEFEIDESPKKGPRAKEVTRG